jgi:Arc/MetJ-type ribon-helix-helix transcriptional regulator
MMNVTIPKSLEGLVREKAVEGRYSSEEEVVAAPSG